MKLTKTLAERVAARMRRDGYACTANDVWYINTTGTHENEFLASAVLQEFEEIGVDEFPDA